MDRFLKPSCSKRSAVSKQGNVTASVQVARLNLGKRRSAQTMESVDLTHVANAIPFRTKRGAAVRPDRAGLACTREGYNLTGDTRKIFVSNSRTVDESN